jgi:hypothetical protein
VSATGLATDVSTPVYLADSLLGPTPQVVDLSTLLGLTAPTDSSVTGDVSSLLSTTPTSSIFTTDPSSIATLPGTTAYTVPADYTSTQATVTPTTMASYMPWLIGGFAVLILLMVSKK